MRKLPSEMMEQSMGEKPMGPMAPPFVSKGKKASNAKKGAAKKKSKAPKPFGRGY